MNNSHLCLECGASLSEGVYTYSIDTYNFPLCQNHQRWLDTSLATEEAIKLYFALKLNAIPAVLEYAEGHRKVDIAIPGKLFIHIDVQSDSNNDQALTEVLRNFHSLKGGVPSISIPAELVQSQYEFNLVLERLVEVCTDLKKTG